MTDLPHDKVTGKHGAAGFELHPDVLNNRDDILAFLRTRRSTVAAAITSPGPDATQLSHIMEAATRVPDHGKLTPWRFILFQDAGKDAFADALQRIRPDLATQAASEATFVRQAPVVVAVIACPVEHPRIPQWEQHLSAGAVCLNLLNAALASGFAAQWRTGWPAYDRQVAHLLRLQPHERVAGFIFIGSPRPDTPLTDRRRPYWQELTTSFSPQDATRR